MTFLGLECKAERGVELAPDFLFRYANSLVAIREAILRWGKKTSYDVSFVLKEIFLAIDDQRARRTWFGYSEDEPCFPDGGFFVDTPFDPNELPPVQLARGKVSETSLMHPSLLVDL